MTDSDNLTSSPDLGLFYAPLVNEVDLKNTTGKAQQIILESLQPLGQE